VIWASVGRRGPVTTRDLYVLAAPHALSTAAAAAVLIALKPLVETPDVLSCGCFVAVSYVVYLTFLMLFPEKRAYLFHNADFIRARFAR
jgi:hypothetical protein